MYLQNTSNTGCLVMNVTKTFAYCIARIFFPDIKPVAIIINTYEKIHTKYSKILYKESRE